MKASNFALGALTGMAVASAASMLMASNPKTVKKVEKSAKRAMNNMENTVGKMM